MLGDPVDVRRLDQATERFHRRETDIVEHDVEHVWRILGRDRRGVRIPVRHRLRDVEVDHTLERLAQSLSTPIEDLPEPHPGMADATDGIAVDLEPEDWQQPVLTIALPPISP
jgi:hypothetical protein